MTSSVFFDEDGIPRKFQHKIDVDPGEEMRSIQNLDRFGIIAGKQVFVVATKWMEEWLVGF